METCRDGWNYSNVDSPISATVLFFQAKDGFSSVQYPCFIIALRNSDTIGIVDPYFIDTLTVGERVFTITCDVENTFVNPQFVVPVRDKKLMQLYCAIDTVYKGCIQNQ